ncbi:MAG TPA: dihydrofolate reductase family protein [Sphingomicrobium sp.]|jgi:dihydrofolate reductase
MRKIKGAAFISLDGVIQAPGGPTEDPTGGFGHGGWLAPIGDMEAFEPIGRLFGGPFDLLLGRRTYDIFAAYWPYAGEEEAEIRDRFNACTKYVLTQGDQPLEWDKSIRLGGMDALAEVRAGDGPDLVIQGSSTIYPQLLEANLLDELTLMIFPVVLGRGKRLFGDGTPARGLEVTEKTVTSRGTAVITYRPTGPVDTAAITPPSASEREEARQQAMAEGRW